MSYKLGDYLRQLRGKESLRSVAERTNGKISHSYISDLEKGVSRRGNKISPSPETLKILASAYNADYNQLMSLAGYSSEPDNEPKLLANHLDKAYKDLSPDQQKQVDNFIKFITSEDNNK